MNTETIERLRTQYPPHLEDSRFMTFELRTETWADILAVLEAAQRWAETSTAIRNTSPVTQEMWASHNQNCDALLDLIDLSDDLRVLGGTK